MTPDLRPRAASNLSLALSAIAALLVAAFVLLRLSAYGIWDPWELSVADAARKLAEGSHDAKDPITLTLRLVGAGFSTFGTREWAGRLPMALSGLGLLAVTAGWTLRFAGRRAALFSAIALGTTPFFLLHSREMVGSSPALLGSALVMLGASAAVFEARDSADERPWAPYAWLSVALLGALIGTYAAGALLTVVPALGAVALVALLTGQAGRSERSPARRVASYVVIAAALIATALVARAVLRHAADYSILLGGSPLDGSVPTYERALEHLFHAFVPWSAVLPVALAAMLRSDGSERADLPLRLTCVAWAALAYAAQTLFLSSYGTAAFPAPAALAVAAGLWLLDREEDPRSYWPEAVVVVMLVALAIRDFALYPASPFNALEIADAKVPEVFNPKAAWAVVLGAFAVAVGLSCMASDAPRTLDLKAPYRGIRSSWQRGVGHKLWLVLAGLSLLGMFGFGVLAWLDPSAVHLTTIAKRVGRVLSVIPLALPACVAIGQIVYQLSKKLAPLRSAPVLAAALLVGGYTSQVFLPQLSEHFSPRDIFETFNQLAKPGEPLAQHKVQGRAAAYYAQGKVVEIASRSELVTYLAQSGRRWAAFPTDQLADIDVAFRRSTGRHLFVPSDDNARVTLVANQPLPQHKDANPLTDYVRTSLPKVEHSVGAHFEDKVELVGYNLELPGGDSVGPGQTFHVTWIWRALQGALGTYKVFVHLDAQNQRLNGDHEPVDGKYPVRLWDKGDVILDRQALSIPATYPPGIYTLYIGFFRGESRLKVVDGPHDDVNRVRAGTVRIR